MLFALVVLTTVLRARTFCPGFYSFAVLLVFLPVAFVACAILVRVDAESMCFVTVPASSVEVTICVEEFPIAARQIELPVTFIACLIGPYHSALAVT